MPRKPRLREQDYQNTLMVALCATGRMRVWRQPAGKIPARRGGMVKAAPLGAADLCGVEFGTGRLLQIECKGPRTPYPDEQKRWGAAVLGWGAVYVLARARRGETLDAFSTRATASVLEALDARLVAGGRDAR